jgi:hypothetical protein
MQSQLSSHAEMERCAHACHECQDMCLALIPHCLSMGGPHSEPEHINALLDCAAICGVSHNMLHRQSELHVFTCQACAQICRACADDCEQIGRGDRRMMMCVEACDRCADLCERMAA